MRPAEPTGMSPFHARAFRRREAFRPNYEQLSRALLGTLDSPVSSLLDVGSANGFVIDAMLGLGVDEVQGVELSPEVKPFLSAAARQRTRFADATGLGHVGDFDLVTCIEVAEHIPPGRSEHLLDTLAANSTRWIFLTAATPYQPGHGHINCRPHFFWINALRHRRFHLDFDRTERLVRAIHGMEPCTWLPLNSLLFRRADG
jgi:hypothetical protein